MKLMRSDYSFLRCPNSSFSHSFISFSNFFRFVFWFFSKRSSWTYSRSFAKVMSFILLHGFSFFTFTLWFGLISGCGGFIWPGTLLPETFLTGPLYFFTSWFLSSDCRFFIEVLLIPTSFELLLFIVPWSYGLNTFCAFDFTVVWVTFPVTSFLLRGGT